jgi:CDP-4-dehydro-6-deoxyglucose reductase
VLARIAPGGKLGVELAFGQFFLRVADMPAIFLVSGTGFAQIKSIIEDALKRGIGRPMRLYRGARSQDDFYMLGCFATWGRHGIPSYLCFHEPAIRGKAGPAFAWCYKRTVI